METFIIIAIIIYVLIWVWCIYEIKNAQEVDPDEQIKCVVYTLSECVDINTAREIADKAYNKVNK